MAYTLKTIQAHLKKLDENWNNDYWLFAADGELTLMRKKNGALILETDGISMSQKGIIKSYNLIDADGGDW